MSLDTLEARFIRDALARNRWNRTETARELGIHKTTLHRKIRKLAIELPPEDGRTARKAKRLTGRSATGRSRVR
jgi:DNA-binding NtrC family response regulator